MTFAAEAREVRRTIAARPDRFTAARNVPFYPPAPVPWPRPLGIWQLLSTLKRNPLECWTTAHFERPVMPGGLPFKRILLVHEPRRVVDHVVERPRRRERPLRPEDAGGVLDDALDQRRRFGRPDGTDAHRDAKRTEVRGGEATDEQTITLVPGRTVDANRVVPILLTLDLIAGARCWNSRGPARSQKASCCWVGPIILV